MSDQFKGMKFFSDLAQNDVGKQTLIYGGVNNQERSLSTVLGWRSI